MTTGVAGLGAAAGLGMAHSASSNEAEQKEGSAGVPMDETLDPQDGPATTPDATEGSFFMSYML